MKTSLRRVVAALAGGVATLIATAPTASAIDDGPLPGTDYCLANSSGNLYGDAVTDLEGADIAWWAHRGCSDVSFTVSKHSVGASGTKHVDPASSRTYVLRAHRGGVAKVLDRHTVIKAVTYGYFNSPRAGMIKTTNDRLGVPEAREKVAEILNAVTEKARRNLMGRVVETHVIPANADLTDLPDYEYLEGQYTCDVEKPNCVEPRPWSDIRGVGGSRIDGTNRIAQAIGAEEMADSPYRDNLSPFGYVLTHETGHTVLDFAATYEEPVVEDILEARGPDGDYLGVPEYTRSNADEYWAEGTAALFGVPYSWEHVNEYTEQWLQENDNQLWRVLDRVYRNR